MKEEIYDLKQEIEYLRSVGSLGILDKKCKKLQDRIDKALEYGNNCLENLEEYDEYICEGIDIVSVLRMIHKNYIDILKGENNE